MEENKSSESKSCQSHLFISFVLPAYNEEKSVLHLMDQITSAMAVINEIYEVVFVVEGEDKTNEILTQYQSEHPLVKLKILYQKKPLGLTNAFKKGFENVSSGCTHVVTMDVDLNHKPSELPRLIEKAREGYNIVIGSRAMEGSKVMDVPTWKRMISKFANAVFNKAFNINVKDKTSGYRMVDIQTVKEVSPLIKSENFEGLMEFLLIANKLKKKITEVPITLTYREYGQTKFRLFQAGLGYAKLLMGRNLKR